MMWIKVAWRNLWRNKIRSGIQFTVIAGAVALGVIFHNMAIGVYRNMIKQGIRMGSGHVAIYNEMWFQTRRASFTFDEEEAIPVVEGLKDVDRYFRRMYISGYARSPYGGLPVSITAIDVEKEVKDHPLLRGKKFDGMRDIYIGYKIAERLKLREGDKLVVMAASRDGELTGILFRVRGILRTGLDEVDCCGAFARLDYVRNSLEYGKQLHELAIFLKGGSPDKLRDYLNDVLKSPLRAYTWKEAMKELASAITLDYTGLILFMLFLYIVITVGTVNVLFMSVMDRTREFGILRAVGMKRKQIEYMLFTEGLLLGVSASLLGLFIALLVNIYLSTHGLDLRIFKKFIGEEGFSYGGVIIEPVVRSIWEWKGTLGYTLFIILLSVFASYFPVRWINRKDVAQLLRG